MDILNAPSPGEARPDRLADVGLHAVEREGRALALPASGWPALVFRVEDLGLDADRFLRDVRPSFDRMEWDTNDVTNRQLAHLKRLGPPWRGEAEALEAVADPVQRAALVALSIDRLPEDRRSGALPFTPHRRRAIRKYRLEHRGGATWRVEPLADRTFTQSVSDYRALTRAFALMEAGITMHEGIVALLAALAETVRRHRGSAARIDAVVHQVSVVASPALAGNPAPEGVHQDGADYIVSALIVERRGVSGGVSRVSEGPDGPAVLELELAAGEGIFQADAGSPLWHGVSPVELTEGAVTGHRMAFGVDLHVVAAGTAA